MALVQVRGVSDETLNTLKVRAAEQGMSLAAYLRVELDRLAARPTNADVVERLARRERSNGPSVAETVDEIRRLRSASS